MAHSLAGGDKFPGLARDDSVQGRYRFGRIGVKRVRARSASSRVGGHLKEMIEAVADAKLRRMERELELGGLRGSRWDK
jgi:hypothetical protein